MFKNPFSFKGRIRRSEYVVSFFIYFIVNLLVTGLAESSEGGALIGLILIIPMIWFGLAQAAKRCHDRGNTGWYQIIPFYGLWMLFADGDKEVNKYGPDPKEQIELAVY